MNTLSDPTLPLAFALPVLLFLLLWAVFYFVLGAFGISLQYAAQLASVKIARSSFETWAVAQPGGKRLRPYAPILLVLALGGITASGAGQLFVGLSEHFRLTTSWIYFADHAVNAWFQNERHLGLTLLLSAVTTVGGPLGMGLCATAVVAILLLRHHRAPAVFVMLCSGGGALLDLALKMIFERTRPDVALAIASAQGYSFPSGHAMGSTVVLGSIGYLVLRGSLPWKAKSAWLAALVAAVILIGLSRVYLGVHWFSDIAAGWSAGTVWLATGCVAFETYLRVQELHRGAPLPGKGVDTALQHPS